MSNTYTGKPPKGERQPTGTTEMRHYQTGGIIAVRTLIDWYRDGADVAARMPWLSTYLGHREPRYTYWYLTAVPELLALAAGRLETAWEVRP